MKVNFPNKLSLPLISGVILGLSCCFTAIPEAKAVKAKPGIIEFKQPDGSSLPIRLFGDERGHYATTDDGLPLLFNKDGIYEYAMADENGNAVLSGIKAKPLNSRPAAESLFLQKIDRNALVNNILYETRTSRRNSSEHISLLSNDDKSTRYTFSSAAFPVFGEPHSIVVLVEYQDYKFSMDNPNDYYTRFLNEDNFSEHGGTGSCRQYFVENSDGQFKPTFDLYGPVLLKNNRKYYGSGYNEDRAPEMVVEAVKALDEFVDFSQYDHNNDGYVDSIFIIYANTGEADGGPEESVWPHSWELEDAGYPLSADGVKINSYGCSNELSGRKPVGIGTFTHEFSHVMGLPDLYNTVNSSDYTTPGTWSVLDEGPYNNDGRTPPNYSAFERYSLGWLDADEILCSGDYQLENVATSNRCYMATVDNKKDEFYLFENRQKEGWDKYLPGHGMLIWHIDFVQRQWDRGTVNNSKTHQYVELVRADNNKASNMAADAFPGTTQNTTFDAFSSPAFLSWGKQSLNVHSISNITESVNRIISFSATATEDRSGNTSSVINPIEGNDFILIKGNFVTSNVSSLNIYDISGRLAASINKGVTITLDKGFYIINGKKICIK